MEIREVKEIREFRFFRLYLFFSKLFNLSYFSPLAIPQLQIFFLSLSKLNLLKTKRL